MVSKREERHLGIGNSMPGSWKSGFEPGGKSPRPSLMLTMKIISKMLTMKIILKMLTMRLVRSALMLTMKMI